MKITVDIDCTPEEARTFLGLPDVKPMQEAMIKDIQQRMQAGLSGMEPEQLFKTWMPLGIESMEALQKMFWSQAAGAGKKTSD